MSRSSTNRGLLSAIRQHCDSCKEESAIIEIAATRKLFGYAQIGIDRHFQCLQGIDQRQSLQVEPKRASSIRSGGRQELAGPELPLAQEAFVEEIVMRAKHPDRNRVFVTGEGGSGKTVFARVLAWKLAQMALAELDRSASQSGKSAEIPLVPCFVTLGDLTEKDEWPQALDVNGHLDGALPTLIKKQRVAFILDGLDEVTWKEAGFVNKLRKLVATQAGLVVLTGRPGSLEDLGYVFLPQDQFVLEPLNFEDVNAYVSRYFQCAAKPDRGPVLLAAIRQAEGALKPMLRQPFMLALTCHFYAHDKGEIELPGNPAELMDRCLGRLFSKRFEQNDDVPNDAILDTLGALFAGSIEANYAVHQEKAIAMATSLQEALPPHLTVKGWLNLLAKKCGVLTLTAGVYRCTNRVVAEYLATRWIARNGWTESGHSTGWPQTERQIEYSIFSFYNQYVWSNRQRNLLGWLAYALAAQANRLHIVTCLARWLVRTLDSTKSLLENRDRDPWHTLIHRFVDLLSVIPCDTSSNAHEVCGDAEELLIKLVPPESDWTNWLDTAAFAAVPVLYRKQHLNVIGVSISEPIAENASSDKCRMARREIEAISVIWTGDPTALNTMCIALARQKTKEWKSLIAEHIAQGWPNDSRAVDIFCEMLESDDCGVLLPNVADTIIHTWPGNIRLLTAACRRIQVEQRLRNVALLAKLITKGWAEDPEAVAVATQAKHRLCAALRNGGKSESDIRYVVCTMAEIWTADLEVMKTLGSEVDRPLLVDCLCRVAAERSEMGTALLRIAIDTHLATESGPTAAQLVQECASGRHLNPETMKRVFAVLCDWLKKEEGAWSFFEGTLNAIVEGWAGDTEVLAYLRSRLKVAKYVGDAACLAKAIIHGWPKGYRAVDEVFEALCAALNEPQCENDSCLIYLEHTVDAFVEGWPGESHVLELLSRRIRIENNPSAVMVLAEGIARGWPGNPKALVSIGEKLEAYDYDMGLVSFALSLRWTWPANPEVLAIVLARLNKINIRDSALTELAFWFPGNDNILMTFLSRQPSTALPYPLRDNWVVLLGLPCNSVVERGPLGDWIAHRGWTNLLARDGVRYDWLAATHEIESVTGTPQRRTENVGTDTLQTSFAIREYFVAPREQLRGGLDPALRPPTVKEIYMIVASFYDPQLIPWDQLADSQGKVIEMLDRLVMKHELCMGTNPPETLTAKLVEITRDDAKWSTCLRQVAGQVAASENAGDKITTSSATTKSLESSPEPGIARKKAGGRPRITPEEERWRKDILRLCRESGQSRKDFCYAYNDKPRGDRPRDRKITVEDLDKFTDWAATRKKRAAPAGTMTTNL